MNDFNWGLSSKSDWDIYRTPFLYYCFFSLGLLVSILSLQAFSEVGVAMVLKEDGPIEWLSFVTLFLGSLLAGYLTYEKVRSEGRLGLSCTVLLFLMAGFMFAALEEISYGQRIFDFESGDFFLKNNAQDETNLHNMVVNGVKVNKLIFGKLLFLALLGHNLIWPFMIRKLKWAKNLHVLLGNFIPQIPQIIVLIVIALGVDLIDFDRKRELLEFSGCLFYVLAMTLAFGFGLGGGPRIEGIPLSRARKILMGYMVLVPTLAALFTYVSSSG